MLQKRQSLGRHIIFPLARACYVRLDADGIEKVCKMQHTQG